MTLHDRDRESRKQSTCQSRILNLNIIPLLIINSRSTCCSASRIFWSFATSSSRQNFSCRPCPTAHIFCSFSCFRSPPPSQLYMYMAQQRATATEDFIFSTLQARKMYSPASEERWLIPLLISCFPMFEICCDCDAAVKLFCETNCAELFLLLLDDDDDWAEVECFLWIFGCSCCCADGGDGKFDDASFALLLWFLRNLVRKPLSGG